MRPSLGSIEGPPDLFRAKPDPCRPPALLRISFSAVAGTLPARGSERAPAPPPRGVSMILDCQEVGPPGIGGRPAAPIPQLFGCR
jgi:hypothetical protein